MVQKVTPKEQNQGLIEERSGTTKKYLAKFDQNY
jgi:hypothetical protein